jgi:hypothetical protein
MAECHGQGIAAAALPGASEYQMEVPMNANTDKPSGAGNAGRAGRADDRDDSQKSTPAADMQPEDAHTEAAAERDARATAGGTPAEQAMKQEQKTDAERQR